MQKPRPFSSLVLASVCAFQSFCALPHAALPRDGQVAMDTVDHDLSDVRDAQATDSVDVLSDVSPVFDGDVADVATDTPANDSDVVDATAPDVQPDVVHDVILVDVIPSDTVDVMMMDSAPLPRFRYEVRLLASADPTAADPMHLKIRGGADWSLITCLNTGTTTMELVPPIPGGPNGYRRCDTDVLYDRFVFDYQSGLFGPNTNTVGGPRGCNVRDGVEIRFYDLLISAVFPIAVYEDGDAGRHELALDCSGVYWTHQLPDSVRDR